MTGVTLGAKFLIIGRLHKTKRRLPCPRGFEFSNENYYQETQGLAALF